jgi:hypothetical protein
MATFDVEYRTAGIWDLETSTFTPVIGGFNESYPRSTTDGSVDSSYSSGDVITMSDGSVDIMVQYIGFYLDGFVARSGFDYYYYSANFLLSPSPFVVETETAFPTCFLAGTLVATPTGQRAVEDLAIGDLVQTADGRAARVRWVGIQTIVTAFSDRLHAFPVRIRAGSLDEGLPVRDLLVSPDHALLLEGLLVQAGALVNGTTIVREATMPARFRYYHVELDDHAILLAEGVAAETFVDNVARGRFDNAADYAVLYGDAGATIAEIATPRLKSARQLPRALRERLAARAALQPASTRTAA